MIIKDKAFKNRNLETSQPFVDLKKNLKERGNLKKGSYLRSTYFVRIEGIKNTKENFAKEISYLIEDSKMLKTGVIEIYDRMKMDFDMNITSEIKQKYERYIEEKKHMATNMKEILNYIPINIDESNSEIKWSLRCALEKTLIEFKKNNLNSNDTMIKNFAIKLILWIEHYFKQIEIRDFYNYAPKIFYFGVPSKHEIYFLNMLNSIGFDILIIDSNAESQTKSHILEKKMSELKYDEKCNAEELKDLIKKREVKKESNIRSINQANTTIQDENQINTQSKKKIDIERQKNQRKKDMPAASGYSSLNATNINTNDKELRKLTTEELGEKSESAVKVAVFNTRGKCLGTGSGFMFDERGGIITNYHVVKKASKFMVEFDDTIPMPPIEAKLEYFEEEKDLAIIRINDRTKPLEIDGENVLKKGQKIYAITSPLGFLNTFTSGHMSTYIRDRDLKLIQIDVDLDPGSSGGAIMNEWGKVVAVVVGGIQESSCIRLAIPANEVVEFIKRYKKYYVL